MRDHTKLRAFQLPDQLALKVYELSARFPKDEQFGLTLQMRRAAVSTASNIVEGCARNSELEYVDFLNIAFGSAREVEYQISLARRLGYLHHDPEKTLDAVSLESSKVLGGLLRSLRA